MRRLFAFLLLVLILLLGSGVFALPLPPYNIKVEDVAAGVKVSWSHDQNGLVFNVYRNTVDSFEGAKLVASGEEKFFVDNDISPNASYFYFVTAVDKKTGEESLPKNPVIGSERFYLTLVEPVKMTFSFGEIVKLVFQVNSTNLNELRSLQAVLIKRESGEKQQFEFDPSTKCFSITLKLPEQQQGEGTKNLSFALQASAELKGETLYDSKSFEFSLVPRTLIGQISLNPQLMMLLALLLLCSAALFTWKILVRIRANREKLELDWRKIIEKRALLKLEAFHRRISQDAYNEQELELQADQLTLEKKMHIGGKGVIVRPNPLEGCSPAEIEEITSLARAIGIPKAGFVVVSNQKKNKEQLRAYLVGVGKNEKIAKKTAEYVFLKYEKPAEQQK